MKKIILMCCTFFIGQIIYGQESSTNNNEFKLSTGASFDFQKGISATDLYFDLTYYNLDLWKKTNRKGKNRSHGLDFKLYQSILFSTPIDTNRISSFTSVRLGEASADSIFVGDFSFDRSEELDFTDFGLIIRPTLKLSKTVYLFGHAEFLFRETCQKINYSAIDTIEVRKVPKNFTTKSALPRNRNTKYHDALAFFGVGFNFNLNLADSVYFRIKPTVGFSTVLDASRINYQIGDETIEGKPKFFYLIDIEIIEKKSGIKLGINIQDNDILNNQSLLSQPRFSLFLSKQFSIKKLADFLKST